MRGPFKPENTVPWQPFADYCLAIAKPTQSPYEDDIGMIHRISHVPRETLYRWQRRQTIYYLDADRIAVKQLHTHPAHIWGHDWYANAQTKTA